MAGNDLDRRTFLQQAGLLGVITFLPTGSMHQNNILRPPGAGPDFLAKCIRCGKCVEACPYDSIKTFGLTAGALFHTPYINPLQTPCYLCQQRGKDGKDQPLGKFLRCGAACPSGALRRIVNRKEVLASVPNEFKIGTSILDRDLCLAWQYDSCGECYYNCPLKDKALLDRPLGETLAEGTGIRPYVNPDSCIGCGMCNFVCPVRKHIAAVQMGREIKLTLFEERYAAMVRNVIGRSGGTRKLPAIRVIRGL